MSAGPPVEFASSSNDTAEGEPEPWIRIVKGAFILLSVSLNIILLTYLVSKARRRKNRYYP